MENRNSFTFVLLFLFPIVTSLLQSVIDTLYKDPILLLKLSALVFIFLLGSIVFLSWWRSLQDHNNIRLPRLPPFFGWRVNVSWPECWQAENTKVVKFELQKRAGLELEVWREGTERLTVTTNWVENKLEVVFPSRQSGIYRFHLTCCGRPYWGSPWERHVLPGIPVPALCRVTGHRLGAAVLAAGDTTSVDLQLQDTFGNVVDACPSDCKDVRCTVDMLEQEETGNDEVSFDIRPAARSPNVAVGITFRDDVSGTFLLRVQYKDQDVHEGPLSLLVLPQDKIRLINNNIASLVTRWSDIMFPVTLVKLSGESLLKPKSVYACLTQKHLVIKEYYFKFIPKKLATYKITPGVKLRELPGSTLIMGQESKPDVETVVTGPDVKMIAATYLIILLRKLGSAQTFLEKKNYFNKLLVNYHTDLHHRHIKIPVGVRRDSILESTYKATRYFVQSEWARLFEVKFEGEPGIDQGGVRREWFDLVTKYIFDPANKIFSNVEEGEGGPVQPNPHPPSHIRLKHYRLAGKLVAKCLYESAMGEGYRQNLNARLATSVLAQIIGLDIHYTMLENDAPELWRTKVKYILENPVEDLELTFTQDEWVGGQLRSVELVSGGAAKAVTDQNKRQYVSQLANYMLATRVSQQMTAFLEGLHTLVPDSLFSLWDEQDLELLLCGLRDYSIDELRATVVILSRGCSAKFELILEWFWQVLTHFTQEDLSRFVQFCTGSSLLPPGGWGDLKPNLQISFGNTPSGSLPTSHTCFNHLVLPDANSYQQLEKSLLTAVREGSEGFLLS